MSEVDAEALYHRTLDGGPSKLGYSLLDLPDGYAKSFRKAGALTAYTFSDKKLVPIMCRPKKDQDFSGYATSWERRNSTLIHGVGAGRADPIVDGNFTVIGYLGDYTSNEFWFSRAISQSKQQRSGGVEYAIEMGGLVVDNRPVDPRQVDSPNQYNVATAYHQQAQAQAATRVYRQSGYRSADDLYGTGYGTGYEWAIYTMVVDPEGRVVKLLGYRDREKALESPWYSPTDIIQIPKLLLLAGKAVAKKVIYVLARRRLARLETKGATAIIVGEPPPAPQIPTQVKQVTTADMLRWEKEGHVLQHHGPTLTREKLKERVLRVEKNIAAPDDEIMIAGELTAVEKEWRVWQGKGASAASAWESDEVMRKAIGDIINKNLDKIKRDLATKGEVEIAETLGYKTGHGWVTATAKVQKGGQTVIEKSGAFWRNDLRGVKMIIRPRRNYVAGADDFESWYVHTAYPEVGR